MKKLTYYCYIFALLLFVQGFPSHNNILTINGGLKEKQTLSSNPIDYVTSSGVRIRIIIALPDGSSINDCKNCTNNNAEPHHEHVKTDEPNTPGLDDKCFRHIDCSNVPYSECIRGKCLCQPNYLPLYGRCFGLIDEACERDCAIKNSICFQNTCQCPTNYYFENNYCYKFPDKLYTPADTAKACLRFNHSIFKNKQCECLEGYYPTADQCYQIPSGPGIAVKTPKACNFLTDCYYANGKCHSYVRNFKDSCHAPNGCKIDFSTCSNGKCVCKSNYFLHNNVCYGLPNAECTKPSDCLSTSYSCVSGTCQNVDIYESDKLVSKKPGITSYWIKDSNGEKASQGVYVGEDGSSLAMYVCRAARINLVVPGKFSMKHHTCNANITNSESHDSYYELLIGNDVEWKKTNFTLDKAIFGGNNKDGLPSLSCRVNITSQTAAAGNLEPPLYNECFIPYADKITPYPEFDVLIHK